MRNNVLNESTSSIVRWCIVSEVVLKEKRGGGGDRVIDAARTIVCATSLPRYRFVHEQCASIFRFPMFSSVGTLMTRFKINGLSRDTYRKMTRC